jgi:hypothetical protein
MLLRKSCWAAQVPRCGIPEGAAPRVVVKLKPECFRKQKGSENMIGRLRIGAPLRQSFLLSTRQRHLRSSGTPHGAAMPAAPSQGIRPGAGITGRDAASKLAASKAVPQRGTPLQTRRVMLARCGGPVKSLAEYFFKGTKLPISLKTGGRDETNRGTKLPFCHYGRDENVRLRRKPVLESSPQGRPSLEPRNGLFHQPVRLD